jgi:hypothetical protein
VITNIICIWNGIFSGTTNVKISNSQAEIQEANNLTIQFPKLFIEEIFFKQVIQKNFEQHADTDRDISVSWEIDKNNNILKLKIENTCREQCEKGSQNGTQILETIRGLSDFSFEHPYIKDNTYIQSYNFKIYYNG